MTSYHDIPGVEIFGSNAASYTLPAGYVDSKGVIHREIFIRELNGFDEDEMDNNDVSCSERISRVLKRCIERIGTVTDKNIIAAAIDDSLPEGEQPLSSLDRLMAIVFLRRVTLGSVYNFERKCPKCNNLNRNKQTDLRTLDIQPQLSVRKRHAAIKLPGSGKAAVLKILSARRETQAASLSIAEKDLKNCAILARLESLDERPLLVDEEGLKVVRQLTLQDRKFIMHSYAMMEGGLDTDVQVRCKNPDCGIEFEFPLDFGQTYFLQPGKESKFGNNSYVIGPRFFAFLPVGNRARLEHDCVCLAEAYQWDPEATMRLPVSRRHRFIKMREVIINSRNGVNSSLDTISMPEHLRQQGEDFGSGRPNLSKTGIGHQDLGQFE